MINYVSETVVAFAKSSENRRKRTKITFDVARAKTQKVDLDIRGALQSDHIFRIMRDSIS